MPTTMVQAIAHREAAMARRIHAIQLAAYAQEASLLGLPSLPGMTRGAQALQALDESFLGAFVAAQLVGALSLETAPDHHLHICSLAVLPAHQRRGVGRSLLRHLIAHAPAGATITVSTAHGNAPALALYTNEGFEIFGHGTVADRSLTLVHLRRHPTEHRP